MASRAPLLDDNHPPALSGPPQSALEEESPLARLITESTPPSYLMPLSGVDDETDPNNAFRKVHKKASFTTILAGFLVILQWGFIWGAYFSDSWMDSHMQIYIGWQERFLPWLDKHTDIVLQGLNVFTLSDALRDNESYGSLAGLWICSVVLPSVFMVVCPIWVLTDYSSPPERRGLVISRMWLELTVRLSWLAAFILLYLNVCIGGIELSWDDTDLQVHNSLRGAYISCIVGCTCSMLSVVVLRMPYLRHLALLGYPDQRPKRDPRYVASVPDPTPPQAQRAPPANAFQLPWLNSVDSDDDLTTEAERPLLGNGGGRRPTSAEGIPTWKHVVIFQLSLLSVLLCFPAFALASFRSLYSGVVVELYKTTAFNVYVWELPIIIWNSARKANTPLWILIPTGLLIGTFVILMPLLAYGVAIKAWFQGRGKWRDLLSLIHPTMLGVPFAAAMVVTVPSFINVGATIDGSICVQIENVIENQCLQTGGVRLWGSWFLLAQALCLETLVVLTLWWTAAPKPPTITI